MADYHEVHQLLTQFPQDPPDTLRPLMRMSPLEFTRSVRRKGPTSRLINKALRKGTVYYARDLRTGELTWVMQMDADAPVDAEPAWAALA